MHTHGEHFESICAHILPKGKGTLCRIHRQNEELGEQILENIAALGNKDIQRLQLGESSHAGRKQRPLSPLREQDFYPLRRTIIDKRNALDRVMLHCAGSASLLDSDLTFSRFRRCLHGDEPPPCRAKSSLRRRCRRLSESERRKGARAEPTHPDVRR
eukprot:6080060-Pleurochrysis_carterae.AAC.2